jgi:hypothetical protein
MGALEIWLEGQVLFLRFILSKGEYFEIALLSIFFIVKN